MASFDLVSKVDTGELKNALLQTKNQIAGRFDFKGSKISLELKENCLEILAEDELKIKTSIDILRTNMAKRGISAKAIDIGKSGPSGKQMFFQELNLKQGIDKETGKLINKIIKESGHKVTGQYMDEKVRVTGKKIDELQSIFNMLRNEKKINLDLQMENLKR
jgi:cyclic-di-GMP-binding protein